MMFLVKKKKKKKKKYLKMLMIDANNTFKFHFFVIDFVDYDVIG
jgi:hypothetical protein